MSSCILLVEDNTPIRENTIELLELCNYEVIHAFDGEQGLALLEKKKPDLIISDIMMPGINGYDLLQIIRNDPGMASIPFIFFTAHSEKKDIEKALELGATDYIVKPFEADDLIRMVEKYL